MAKAQEGTGPVGTCIEPALRAKALPLSLFSCPTEPPCQEPLVSSYLLHSPACQRRPAAVKSCHPLSPGVQRAEDPVHDSRASVEGGVLPGHLCPHRWHLRTCQGQHAEPLLGQGSVPTRHTPACLAWGTWATASMDTGTFCLSLVADSEVPAGLL